MIVLSSICRAAICTVPPPPDRDSVGLVIALRDVDTNSSLKPVHRNGVRLSHQMKSRCLGWIWAILLPITAGAVPNIDALFKPLIDAKAPGAAVEVRQDGHIVFQRGYGVCDLQTLHEIGPRTNFRLASVSKQFTAMAIMLLVHDGKLNYDRRLTDIFADFPNYGRAITIRALLTHTSGLPDYEALMGPQWSATHQITDEAVFDLLKQQSVGKFAPGTSWDYSNSGYVVLGLIVARVSGQSFPRFLYERIFKPLQMTSTLAYVKGQKEVENRAYGYSRNLRGELVASDQSSTSATLGDGGVYSNLLDLAKWDEALRKDTLLTAGEMAVAFTPVTLADGSKPSWPLQAGEDNLDPGKPVAYGFGWFLDPYKGHVRVWHSGSTSGFRTVIDRFLTEHLSIIILSNRTDLDPSSLALQIADMFPITDGAKREAVRFAPPSKPERYKR
jgi:CubicO group peptidase (beta-lactamase class C family)